MLTIPWHKCKLPLEHSNCYSLNTTEVTKSELQAFTVKMLADFCVGKTQTTVTTSEQPQRLKTNGDSESRSSSCSSQRPWPISCQAKRKQQPLQQSNCYVNKIVTAQLFSCKFSKKFLWSKNKQNSNSYGWNISDVANLELQVVLLNILGDFFCQAKKNRNH